MTASITARNFSLSAAIISVCSVFLILEAGAAQKSSARDALWQIVHNDCVPSQALHQDPSLCTRVDLSAGVDRGFAILKDIRGASQFLLIATAPISGIESPAVLAPDATNYFADAWEARSYVLDALHRTLPREDIGLAINSAASRSQDQLHIHIDCVVADIPAILRQHESSIGSKWTPLNMPFVSHRYMAMWLPGEHLGSNNPFKLLAEGVPGAAKDMADYTLVVVGSTRASGAAGFVILEDQVNRESGDLASGEELLDHSCRIAAAAPQAPSAIKP
jgi:CDP-diacylglycerol pyrophosphatase